MTKSEEIKDLAVALVLTQAELKAAKKTCNNAFFNSHYADFAAVVEAARGPLAKNNLAVLQTIGGDGDSVAITTMLLHTSGQHISDTVTVKPRPEPLRDKDKRVIPGTEAVTAQGMGSAITYMRRYAFAAIVGVVTEDDDGAAASGTTGKGDFIAEKPAKKQTQADNVIPMPAAKPDNGNGVKPKAGKQAIIEEIIAAIKRRAGADKKVKLQLINETFGCDWAAVIQLEEPSLLAGLAKLN